MASQSPGLNSPTFQSPGFISPSFLSLGLNSPAFQSQGLNSTAFHHWDSILHHSNSRDSISPEFQSLGHNSTQFSGIAEVQVKEWHVKEGDSIAEFDELCSVQSDKASVTITSRYNGTIRKMYYQPDDIAKVGLPLVDIEIVELSSEEEKEAPANVLPTVKTDAPSSLLPQSPKVIASPAVRRLIREYGVNTVGLIGSGRDGRILKEDILKLADVPPPTSFGKSPDSVTDFHSRDMPSGVEIDDKSSSADDSPNEQRIPIRGYMRTMVRTMTEALRIPHFVYSDEIVADQLVQLKKHLAPIAAQKGLSKLGFMPIFVKATSLALTKFPLLNASFDPSNEQLILKRSHNISLAIDTPDGLAVPNIKNCQKKTIWEIASEFEKLCSRAREGRLSLDDLSGGTFSLSNVGSIGGTYMSPLLLPPQLVIGAIGSIRKIPRFDRNGNLVATQMVTFSWSADHRVIDGATLARFSNCLKEFLEQPETMLAELR
ncbi:hypothetical protein niasHT_015417 [Heterodera trifolii]|uniref:Dihydrolipoamide acetyltransferase component of pyruvate dehydrogenase complex n=1 Tax=Heterodera trifolii TaxID=157864 RepID=A0ABD2KZU7_9BILA